MAEGQGKAVRSGASSPRRAAFRVLGIDPGLASLGWGLVESGEGRLRHVAHGIVTTPSGEAMGARLLSIAKAMEELLERYRPVAAGMESLFFWRNVSSAFPVAEARGAIRLTFERAGLELVDYSPTAIKQAVVGSSRAEKAQVQEMVRLILGLAEPPRPDHAADALAAAICRCHNLGTSSLPEREVRGGPAR